MKAMMNDVTTIAKFCRRMVERSTTIVRNKVASVSRRDESIALVLFISSNHPISFLKRAAIKQKLLREKKSVMKKKRKKTGHKGAQIAMYHETSFPELEG